MQFTENDFHHIYNRGNDKQTIFFQERNYNFFLQKVEKYIAPNADLVAWCLMPNHFHFLIRANSCSTKIVKEKPIPINALTEGIRLMLSSYTKAIQKQESITGNLFQQKTKFKCVDEYLPTVFHYIHQNALKAKLVNRLEDWKWSSIQEYLGRVKTQLCKREIANQYVEVNWERLLEESYLVIPDDIQSRIL
jgi:putative transposase